MVTPSHLDRDSSAPPYPCAPRTTLSIRPIRPSDSDALQSAFEHQSMQSRYYRFHSALRRLPDRLLHDLTHVDGIDHVALVAFESVGSLLQDGVGVARFVRDARLRDNAELAIAVAEHAQGHGIARRLLHALAAKAKERGIRTFTMHVLAANSRVRQLLASLGAEAQGSDADVILFHIAVDALTALRSEAPPLAQ
jgi:RimJ/RimL family protein N-acetyltransferase